MSGKDIKLSLGKIYVGSIERQISTNIFIVRINGYQLTSYSDINFHPNEKIFVSVIKKQPKLTLKLLKSLLFNNLENMEKFISYSEMKKFPVSIFNQWFWVNFLKDAENISENLSKQDLERLTTLAKIIPENHNIPFELYVNLTSQNPDLFEKIIETQQEFFRNRNFKILPELYEQLLQFLTSENFQENNLSEKYGNISYKYYFWKDNNFSIYLPIKYLQDNEYKIYSFQLFHLISDNSRMLAEIKLMNKKTFVYLENEDILSNENYQKLLEKLQKTSLEKLMISKKPILTLYDKIIREVI